MDPRTKLDGELVDIAWRGEVVHMTWSAGNLAIIQVEYDPKSATGKLAVFPTPYTARTAKAAFDACLMTDLKR